MTRSMLLGHAATLRFMTRSDVTCCQHQAGLPRTILSIMPSGSTEPLRAYLCHDHSDERYLQQLRKHLAPLANQGVLSLSDATRTTPGRVNAASTNVAEADVVLLLISAAFVSNHSELIEHAMRQTARGALVIPVLLRPVTFELALGPGISVLPSNRRPIVAWRNVDAAWLNVVESLLDQLRRDKRLALPASRRGWVARHRGWIVGLGLGLLMTAGLLWGLGLDRRAPFPKGVGGVIVRGHLPGALWPNSTFQTLCRSGQQRVPQSVRCHLGLGAPSAPWAGATLVLDVPDGHSVLLLSDPATPVSIPLGLLALPPGEPATKQLLAVALQLSRWFVPSMAPQAQPSVEVPAVSAAAVGEELALLSAFVRWRQRGGTLSESSPQPAERTFLHTIATQCDERPRPSWQCQLASFLYAMDCPGCPGATAALVRLSQQSGPLRGPALLQLAEADCRSSPPKSRGAAGSIRAATAL
jgi:hypothetical protein